jgi:hypothetical protein
VLVVLRGAGGVVLEFWFPGKRNLIRVIFFLLAPVPRGLNTPEIGSPQRNLGGGGTH